MGLVMNTYQVTNFYPSNKCEQKKEADNIRRMIHNIYQVSLDVLCINLLDLTNRKVNFPVSGLCFLVTYCILYPMSTSHIITTIIIHIGFRDDEGGILIN